MTPDNRERQLELFGAAQPSTKPRHRETLGRFFVHVRYDQLMLVGIAGLMAVTVIFACGVERGKQLVRGERALFVREQPAPLSTPPGASGSAMAVPAAPSIEKTPVLTPLAPNKAKEPSKSGSGRSRYAVQVVTYSRPQLAKMELQRLKAKGEQAFLMIREGRTSVYVGPFESKGYAQKHVVRLKTHYQDCFVKSL